MAQTAAIPKVEVVGPPALKGRWFAIKEDGVISQARFVDASAAWVAWREYSTGRVGGDPVAPSSSVQAKRRMF